MNRTFKLSAVLTLLFVIAATVPSGFAHHSIAAYNTRQLVTFKGTIKAIQWTNPHVTIWVYDDAKGTDSLWGLEAASPGILTRGGWSKRAMSPGEKVTIEMNPMRDGTPGRGFFRKATTTSGKVWTFDFADIEKPGLP